ncbi:MAG: hypothetical protein C0502_03455 [Opitutus sp.]|nr:hypothetical protein [Opitutus sp.]
MPQSDGCAQATTQPPVRPLLGFIFRLHNLIADLTVEENLRVPALAVGAARKNAAARILELAKRAGRAHHLAHRVQRISGGERQRVAICRALMNRPRLLLADEPTGSLDGETGNAVSALLHELVSRDGIAVVLTTHERRFAEDCGLLVRVRDGQFSEVRS